MNFKDIIARKKGFTIVEILVVIAVVGILASISVVGYGAWKKSASTAQVKSDLNAAAAAMENARTFSNAYPATLPGTVTPSTGVALSGGSADSGKTYCVDGSSLEDLTIVFYVDSTDSEKGAQAGTCATRPNLPVPTVPGNLAVVSVIGIEVSLSWDASTNVISYTAQCASDPSFSLGLQETTHTSVTGVVDGLTPSSSYYCRVKAVNNTGSSSWSSRVSTATNDAYGSLAVATSIEGYWTTTAPQGFLFEDGSEVSRSTYADLFAVIGTTYGAGNGISTFNLPDSRGRTTVNKNTSDAEFATIGQKTGSKTEALTIAQLASHTHTQDVHAHGANNPSHNHTQNAHTHTANNSSNGDAIGISGSGGSEGGWGISNSSNGNIYRLILTSTTAINNATATAVSVNSATADNQSTGGGATHNNIQPSIVKMSAIKYSPIDSTAMQLPAGTSIQGYWSTAPAGFVLEGGAAVSRTTNSDLFSAIGTTYGAGDGSTTFNLPNSQGRVGVNKSTDTEFDTMGEKPGSKTEALTIAQLASHNHTQNSHSHSTNNPSHNHTQNAHQHEGRSTSNGDYLGLQSGGQGGWALKAGVNNTIYRLVFTNTTATNNAATTTVSFGSTTSTNHNTGSGSTHNNIQPSIVKLAAIKTTAATTTGLSVAPGTSIGGYWSSAVPPTGYLSENGAAVSRTTYAALFNAIGTTYGAGDGSTTFNLPNSQGRVGVNKSTDTEFDTMGEKPGSKTEALTIAQLASHNHTQNSHSHSTNNPSHNHTQNPHSHEGKRTQNGDYLGLVGGGQGGWGLDGYSALNNDIFRMIPSATTATNNSATTAVSVNSATATNQSTGSGSTHNNLQPSIVKMFFIKF